VRHNDHFLRRASRQVLRKSKGKDGLAVARVFLGTARAQEPLK
jgi:hypothetical protein